MTIRPARPQSCNTPVTHNSISLRVLNKKYSIFTFNKFLTIISLNKKAIYQFSENTISLGAIKTIHLGLTVWLIPFLIVKVGIVNYGMYAFAMSLVLLFVNVLNYGFSLSTVREIAKNKENPVRLNTLVSEVFSVKIVLFIIEYLLFIALIMLFPSLWEQKEMYFFTSFFLIAELFSLRWFFLGMEKMKFLALMNVGSTFMYVVLVVFFIKEPEHYVYIPLFEVVGITFIAIAAFVWVLKAYKIKLKWIGFKEVLTYLKLNFNSFINLLLPSTFGTIVVFLVGVFGMPAHVSFMQIGLKISSAFSTVNTILTLVFYPMVNKNSKTMLPARAVLLGVGFVLSVSLYVVSDYLIVHWLLLETTEEYAIAIQIVQILSPIPFLMSVISSYGINGLLTFYKDTLYSKITLISTLTTVIFIIVLQPSYPFLSGAIALLVGRFVYASWSFLAFHKINK